VPTEIRQYVRSLGLDAYVVGGAVRDELLGVPHADEDFLVPGVDHAGLRALLEPHGRIEDLEVHGQLVGVRMYPRDRAIRSLAPAGIELTPPRAERSTGPGHRDFAIVSDASIGIQEDMARRDFTINAMARRLSTCDDPLRILRGLRLVSQLGFTPTGQTLAAMRVEAPGLRHVSAERIGGGLAADGMGELSKLLMGERPFLALRLARATGILEELLPELAPAVGFEIDSERQPLTLAEHLFAVVQRCADGDSSLPVRLAALLHDAGKPSAGGEGHAVRGARIARSTLRRLRYPVPLQRHVEAIVRAHDFRLDAGTDGRRARRFLAEHGDERAFDLMTLKDADLSVKHVPEDELEALAALRLSLEREQSSPHRLGDLAVRGRDLIEIGFHEGPPLGRVLAVLLDEVLDEPARNTRETLLTRARRELP